MVLSSALAFLDNSTDTGTTVIAVICALVITSFYLAAMWRIYAKAGKPGWAVIIPIYNSLVLLQIVGRPWWWLLLYLIPVVNIVIGIIEPARENPWFQSGDESAVPCLGAGVGQRTHPT